MDFGLDQAVGGDAAGYQDGNSTMNPTLFNAPYGITYNPNTPALFVGDTGPNIVSQVTKAGIYFIVL